MKRFQSKQVDIVGFPVDLGSGRRGVDMGPSALRIAQLSSRLMQLGYEISDRGDIPVQIMERQNQGDPKLKYLDEILRASTILAAKVESILDNEHFPLCIGGDHSMALGTIAGISAHCSKNNKVPGVIWIDAHADMNTHESTPSGNIHGMPLSASLGYGHESLTKFFGAAPKVLPENCVIIGARSLDTDEKEIIRKSGLSVYTMNDVDKLGVHRIISRVLKQFNQSVDHIHVSFDVDSVDPMLAPGVGSPVQGGLTFREAHLLMETIAECGCMSSLEIAEVNPILDTMNRTAEFTVDLIASSMGQRIF